VVLPRRSKVRHSPKGGYRIQATSDHAPEPIQHQVDYNHYDSFADQIFRNSLEIDLEELNTRD
jgi:uncharacterized protein (DUF2249 family)